MDDAAPLIIESDGTRRKGSTRHLTDEWLLEFPDKTLRYLRFDHSIRLQIGASLVGIESPFELLRNGATHRCDPDDPQSVVPLLKLWPDNLVTATVEPNATLTMSFTSGASISVAADPNREAWEVRGPGTFLVVCNMDPGSISVWE